MSPYRENAKMPDRLPKAGDVVKLKSGGGPTMTIAYVGANGVAICRYFSEGGNLLNHNLEVCVLKVVECEE